MVRARAAAEAAREIAARQMPLFYPAATAVLALVAQAEGKLAEAGELLATLPSPPTLDVFFHLLTPELATCHQALLRADYAHARALSERVLAFLEAQRLQMFLPDFLYLHGQALAGLGEWERARAALERAVAVLEATGSPWQRQEIDALLAALAAEG